MRACKLSLSPLPRARAGAVAEARHVGAHCSSKLISLLYCVRDDCLRQLTCRTRDQSTPRSVSAARKDQDIGQTVALVPDWERPSAPGTFNWFPPPPHGPRTEYGTAPNLCLTYPNKLRNVTQHKSGLVCPWRQASVSEPQRGALVVPLTHHATNLIVPMVLRCAEPCSAGPHCAGPHCAVLCAVITLPCCPANIKHHLSSNRPKPCHLGQLTLTADVLGARPRRSGRALSDLIKPVHTIDASNGAGGLNSHAGWPKWFPLHRHRFRPKDAALERVLDAQVY